MAQLEPRYVCEVDYLCPVCCECPAGLLLELFYSSKAPLCFNEDRLRSHLPLHISSSHLQSMLLVLVSRK